MRTLTYKQVYILRVAKKQGRETVCRFLPCNVLGPNVKTLLNTSLNQICLGPNYRKFL